MWNLLPYEIRCFPQRLFHHTTSTLAGRTCIHFGGELSNFKNLEVLDIRAPRNWSSSRDQFFGKHFFHGVNQCLYQLLKNPKGQFIWRLDYLATSESWIVQYLSNPWFASQMSPDVSAFGLLNLSGLVAGRMQWMRLMKTSGSWQSSLYGTGFYQMRGRVRHHPLIAWTSMEIDVWLSEDQVDGAQLIASPTDT